MKVFLVIFVLIFSCVALFSSGENVAAETNDSNSSVNHLKPTVFPFESSVGDKFDVQIQAIGKYAIDTKLGSDRLQRMLDELKDVGFNIELSKNPTRKDLLILMKFSIPKAKKLKTSDILFILDHCSVRPADLAEAMSLDAVEQSVLDTKLKVFVFGTFIKIAQGQTMVFTPTYAALGAQNALMDLDSIIKEDKVWEGEMIIPVIIVK